MKLITKKEILPVLLIIIMLIMAVSLYTCTCTPDKFPIHWNVQGQIDGWAGKTFALFFFPGLIVAIYLLMLFLPKLDPWRKNYQHFATAYYFIRLVLVLFFIGLYFFTLLAGFGHRLDIMHFIVPFLSLIFVVLGAFMPKIKKNYFVGLRTPWTLQSDEVWGKTHRLGGITFVLAGFLTFFTVFLNDNVKAFWVFIILIIIAALLPIIYSYFVYRQMGLFKKNEHENTQ